MSGGTQTKEEDDLVVELVMKHGPKNWSFIAKHLPGRIGKQCRERWHNHLNPDIRKERWTEQEDQAIIEAHKKYPFPHEESATSGPSLPSGCLVALTTPSKITGTRLSNVVFDFSPINPTPPMKTPWRRDSSQPLKKC